MQPSIHIHAFGALLVCVTTVAACAVMPPPTAKVATAAAGIRAAEELRAVDIPDAQLRLQYAQDEYQAAQKQIEAGDEEKAERLLDRSAADAELAVAIAKQVRAEKAAAAAQLEVQKVNTK